MDNLESIDPVLILLHDLGLEAHHGVFWLPDSPSVKVRPLMAQKLGEFLVVRVADLPGATQGSDAMPWESLNVQNPLLGMRAKMLSPQPLRAARTSRDVAPSPPRLRHPFKCP